MMQSGPFPKPTQPNMHSGSTDFSGLWKMLSGLFSGGGGQQLNNSLRNQAMNYMNNGLHYTGNLNVVASPLERQLGDVLSKQLNGQNLGMSDAEMKQRMSMLTDALNEQRTQGVTSTMQNLNQRGILGSDIAVQGLNKVDKDYSKALTDAGSNMYLQNEMMKRQAMQNAMMMSQNLSQFDLSRQTGNIDRNYGAWQWSQTAPYQMAMQYMQGVQIPKDQQNAQNMQGFGQLLGQLLASMI